MSKEMLEKLNQILTAQVLTMHSLTAIEEYLCCHPKREGETNGAGHEPPSEVSG
ncbi:MAG: hypothetical protein JSU59_07790 [Nitrospirota bacterium]|nr:MAG: hypothetical protein JSU59_07790 [Nitrospirota bacterium]